MWRFQIPLQYLAKSAESLVAFPPMQAGASFNPASVNTAGSSTLTVTTARSTTRGTFTLTVQGTGGGFMRTTTVSLTVTK